jgi:hypothetical protein
MQIGHRPRAAAERAGPGNLSVALAEQAPMRRLRVIVIAPVALAVTAVALLTGGWSSSPGACKAAPAASHSSHSMQGRTPSNRVRPALCQLPGRPAMAAR